MRRKMTIWVAALMGVVLLGGGVLLAGEAGDEPAAVFRSLQIAPKVVLQIAPAVALALAGPQESRVVILGGRGGRLGIGIADVNKEKAGELKLSGEYGALVTDVNEDSPAEKAGLKEDDVIVEFDGERVRSAAHLVRLVNETPAGRMVGLQVSRAGQLQRMSVELAERESAFSFSTAIPRAPRIDIIPRGGTLFFSDRPRLGVSVDELTPQLAAYFGVKAGEGVLIREVSEGSAAEKAGLKAGDVIVRVDDRKIEDISDLRNALAEGTEDKEEVAVTIVRNRQEQSVQVKPDKLERPHRRRFSFGAGDGVWLDFDTDEWSEQWRRFAEEMRERAREWQLEWRDQKHLRQQELQERLRHWQEGLREQLEQRRVQLHEQLEQQRKTLRARLRSLRRGVAQYI